LLCEMEFFVKRMRNKEELQITGKDGLRILTVMDKILKSMENNKITKL
jgi:hypothetical protein